jgi:hypothetical protein
MRVGSNPFVIPEAPQALSASHFKFCCCGPVGPGSARPRRLAGMTGINE